MFAHPLDHADADDLRRTALARCFALARERARAVRAEAEQANQNTPSQPTTEPTEAQPQDANHEPTTQA